MLGMYLRSKIAVVLAILGLLVLGLGIGQRTIWLPPATISAHLDASVTPAPLTVIGPEVLKAKDGQFTMTIKSAGPIQVAVGQQRDVLGWVGDAAFTDVTGANAEFTSLTAESKSGTQTVPNPAGSDLWVSEDKGSNELSYTWQSPGHGDWALLLSSDGTAAAPSDITLTTDNDASTPWAVPLMIAGSALLAVAALLFFLTPRKKSTVTPGGRRSAVHAPSDPATGALEVEKILASRQNGDVVKPATIAEALKTAAVPLVEPSPEADAKPEPEAKTKATDKDDNPDDTPDGSQLPGTGAPAKSAALKPATPKPNTSKSDKPKPNAPKSGEEPEQGKSELVAEAAAKPQRGPRSSHSRKAGWGAALAAVLVAGTVSPALAETTPAPSASAEASTTAAAPADASVPTLLGSQLDRITSAVATVVSTGDNAKNAKDLEPRVTGMALSVRDANYQIRTKVPSHPAPEPVAGNRILTQVVTTSTPWPRTAVVVTQGETNQLPQLLTLVQQSPRENYKLSEQSPLLPGQTFPKVDKERVTDIALDSAQGLLMSPKDAVAAMGDVLSNPDSTHKASFNDSVYINDVASYRSSTLENSKDATVVFTHTANPGTAAMRTADGGALVVVGYSFVVDSTPTKDATSKLTDESVIALAGGTESGAGIVITYGEPIVMYIPAAAANGKITLTSATRDLISAKLK